MLKSDFDERREYLKWRSLAARKEKIAVDAKKNALTSCPAVDADLMTDIDLSKPLDAFDPERACRVVHLTIFSG